MNQPNNHQTLQNDCSWSAWSRDKDWTAKNPIDQAEPVYGYVCSRIEPVNRYASTSGYWSNDSNSDWQNNGWLDHRTWRSGQAGSPASDWEQHDQCPSHRSNAKDSQWNTNDSNFHWTTSDWKSTVWCSSEAVKPEGVSWKACVCVCV